MNPLVRLIQEGGGLHIHGEASGVSQEAKLRTQRWIEGLLSLPEVGETVQIGDKQATVVEILRSPTSISDPRCRTGWYIGVIDEEHGVLYYPLDDVETAIKRYIQRERRQWS